MKTKILCYKKRGIVPRQIRKTTKHHPLEVAKNLWKRVSHLIQLIHEPVERVHLHKPRLLDIRQYTNPKEKNERIFTPLKRQKLHFPGKEQRITHSVRGVKCKIGI